MARSEQDREDLLREATALVERAELEVAGCAEPVFVGFRKAGEASFFLGQGRAFHFNAAGELRRAYLGGVLYKAERGRLIALRRERSVAETALLRSDLSESDSREFMAALHAELLGLKSVLEDGKFRVAGQFPAGSEIVARVRQWLGALPAVIPIAANPRVS